MAIEIAVKEHFLCPLFRNRVQKVVSAEDIGKHLPVNTVTQLFIWRGRRRGLVGDARMAQRPDFHPGHPEPEQSSMHFLFPIERNLLFPTERLELQVEIRVALDDDAGNPACSLGRPAPCSSGPLVRRAAGASLSAFRPAAKLAQRHAESSTLHTFLSLSRGSSVPREIAKHILFKHGLIIPSTLKTKRRPFWPLQYLKHLTAYFTQIPIQNYRLHSNNFIFISHLGNWIQKKDFLV